MFGGRDRVWLACAQCVLSGDLVHSKQVECLFIPPARPACCRCCSEHDAYAKAYFRRAVLSAWLGDYESARENLAICAQLDESTAEECDRELRRMEAREQAAEAKQRGALKGFFDR